MHDEKLNIRKIVTDDNLVIAKIIKESLKSFGLDIPGTVYTDPTTDDLYSLFQHENSIYFIATLDEEIVGGCGIYPTKGLPPGHAELVKLYLKQDSRGKGLGRLLMEKSMEWARNNSYTHIYLETMNELKSAVGLYEKLGFKNLEAPLGESGHHACQIWMKKTL